MIRHLAGDELVDLAEGARRETSVPHLASCADCRARLADLRSVMSRVAEADLPEPSPVYWDQFSSRVREAIDAEPRPRWTWTFGWVVPASALACAALVLVALMASVWLRQPVVGVPAPVGETPIATEAVDVTLVPPDDPALVVVADLGASLEWQDLDDAGLVAHAGLVDRAVSGLSAGERAELGKLLRQQLRGGGD